MIICPTCGDANADGSRFCSNCGTRLERSPEPDPEPAGERTSDPEYSEPPEPTYAPRRPATDSTELPPSAPEWRMSSPGPLPEPRRRRMWLWIVLGIIGACLLVCILIYIWSVTIGADTIADLSTRAAELSTPDAGDPDG